LKETKLLNRSLFSYLSAHYQTMLIDNHGREINYLRLAVTDRCNLRCFYCMPETGINYLPKQELLTYEEIERLITLLAHMGITKVRLTGGEPFVRRDLMKLIARIVDIPGINDLHLTTNGVLTAPHLPELKKLGVSSVNLSLDSLNRDRFNSITRSNGFAEVMRTFYDLLDNDFSVKINTVVMEDKNIEDIIPILNLTKDYPVSVRFIEEMPFNGAGAHYQKLHWTHTKILSHIKESFPGITPLSVQTDATSVRYSIPGHIGDVGIIAAFSRTFCGSCNRLRITAKGDLKTCLYDDGVLNLKELIRTNKDDGFIEEKIRYAVGHRFLDGFIAEKERKKKGQLESMSTIGG